VWTGLYDTGLCAFSSIPQRNATQELLPNEKADAKTASAALRKQITTTLNRIKKIVVTIFSATA